jgi:hypothetical protein
VETCRHSTALQRPHATPPFFLLLQHEDAGCVAEHWRVAAGDGGGRRRRERESRSRERPARRHQRQPRGVLDPPRACRPGGSCFRWDEPSADTKLLCTTRAQGVGFPEAPVESSRASPLHRRREDGRTHPADPSISNLASTLGVLSRWHTRTALRCSGSPWPTATRHWRRRRGTPRRGSAARRRSRQLVSFLTDANVSLADAKSSLGDAKSSLGDARSSLGDA